MNLSLEQRYHPEQLLARLGPFNPTRTQVSPLLWMPVWIHMDNHFVRLNSKAEVELACKLACIYHNGPDNKAPFLEEDDWQYISEKEAFLAGVRTPESASSTDEVGEDTRLQDTNLIRN
jgi:hypothetical protein